MRPRDPETSRGLDHRDGQNSARSHLQPLQEAEHPVPSREGQISAPNRTRHLVEPGDLSSTTTTSTGSALQHHSDAGGGRFAPATDQGPMCGEGAWIVIFSLRCTRETLVDRFLGVVAFTTASRSRLRGSRVQLPRCGPLRRRGLCQPLPMATHGQREFVVRHRASCDRYTG